MTAGGVSVDDNGVLTAIATLSRGLDDLGATMLEAAEELVEETRPLVPVLTARLVDDLKAEPDGQGGATLSIGRTPRVGDYARIIDARARFMPAAEERAEPVGFERLTDAVDALISRTGLGV